MSSDHPPCPECGEDEEHTVELVYSAGGGQFDHGHSPWDEPGTAHRGGGGGAKTVNYYKCSNGHRWNVEQ